MFYCGLSLTLAFICKALYIAFFNSLVLTALIPWRAMFYTISNFSYSTIFSALVLAPIFETVIFIVLLSAVISRLTGNKLIFIIASAGMFAAYHYPSGGWFRVFITTFAGIVFASAYTFFRQRLSKDNAAFAVMFIHLLNNLMLIGIHWLALR